MRLIFYVFPKLPMIVAGVLALSMAACAQAPDISLEFDRLVMERPRSTLGPVSGDGTPPWIRFKMVMKAEDAHMVFRKRAFLAVYVSNCETGEDLSAQNLYYGDTPIFGSRISNLPLEENVPDEGNITVFMYVSKAMISNMEHVCFQMHGGGSPVSSFRSKIQRYSIADLQI